MEVNYEILCRQFEALVSSERDFLANCANLGALIFQELEGLNWAGVYLLRGDELVLGPFQGRPACTRIPLGSGVCGNAATLREAIIVADVHEFPGHIACDSASNAEIVLPMICRDKVIGVLDLDSPEFDRFSAADRDGLQGLVDAVISHSDIDLKIF